MGDAGSIRCKVLLFGPQSALAGASSLEVEVVAGQTTCAAVLKQVSDACEALVPSLASSRLAVNHVLVDGPQTINGDEELALIGLVGGG